MIGFGIIFFILIVIFSYSRFGRYINGPIMKEISIDTYEEIQDLTLAINGKVKNTETLTINNRTITLNQDNTFNEIIVVSPGLTIIDIYMVDAFGKSKTYQYNIYSTGTNPEYESTYTEALQAQTAKEDITLEENQV